MTTQVAGPAAGPNVLQSVLSVVATTLLPALPGLLGDRIDTDRLVRRHRPAKRAEETALVALRSSGLGKALVRSGRRSERDDVPAGLPPAGRTLRTGDHRAVT